MHKPETYKNWKAVGYRLLVKVKKMEERTEGGIILTERSRTQLEYSSGFGTVVDIGPLAFKAFAKDNQGEPWCKIGDQVQFKSYSGLECTLLDEDNDEATYRFLNDDDIIGVRRV